MRKTKNKPLLGKRVLCIIPEFFHYHNSIVTGLGILGAEVDLLIDRPFNSSFAKYMTKKLSKLFCLLARNKYEKSLTEFGRSKYDYVLIVVGLTVSKEFLNELKRRFPSAKFIYYTWDSVANRPNSLELASICERAFSFDVADAKNYQLEYRPLFFEENAQNAQEDNNINEIDISFIGTLHSDRYTILKKINDLHNFDRKIVTHLYVPSRAVLLAYRLLKPSMIFVSEKNFKFSPLSKLETLKIFQKSRIILDIEHPNQSGLTMRTLEAFGAGKKIISTNKSLLDAEFYNEKNHLIIDRKQVFIPNSFFNDEYMPPSKAIFEKYTLYGWLSEVFDLTTYEN